jgi:hypothetical protein
VTAILPSFAFSFDPSAPFLGDACPMPLVVPGQASTGVAPSLVAAVDPDEDDDLGDEEDLAVSQPPVDEESSFDDFDDEFDDDFEEDPTDPDWDHPDDGDAEPPPGKNTGKKK